MATCQRPSLSPTCSSLPWTPRLAAMMDDLDPFQSNEEAKPAACVRVGAQMDDLDASDGEGDAKLAASARVGALIDPQRRDRSPPNLDSESKLRRHGRKLRRPHVSRSTVWRSSCQLICA